MNPAGVLIMVEPNSFGYNQETSLTNFFQVNKKQDTPGMLITTALSEFNHYAGVLKSAGIKVFIIRHKEEIKLPDGVFPNNWISFLPGGTVVIYPMMALSRRKERDMKVIDQVKLGCKYQVKEILDLSFFELENKFLEGTGSVVFDHHRKIAFASLSPRTHEKVVDYLCRHIGYKKFILNAFDRSGRPVYHTNVVLTITSHLSVFCMDSIKTTEEKYRISRELQSDNRMLLEISMDQMESFAGNMLEVMNRKGKSFVVLSQTAYGSLHPEQIRLLEKFHNLLVVPLETIEQTGGGSARCMLAEVFE